MIDYLYSNIGFNSNSIIADIGAGTGIFSKLLASKGSSVICVEPNRDMINIAKKELSDFINCTFLETSAESTHLNNNSIDFITVAQAFHWFDKNELKKECSKILKPNGKVVLIWNSRDNSNDLIIDNANINKKFCPNFKGFSEGTDESSELFNNFFKNGYYDYKTFSNVLTFDESSFIGRSLSSSYAPDKNSPSYSEYIAALKSLFNKYSKNGKITMINISKCYIGEV